MESILALFAIISGMGFVSLFIAAFVKSFTDKRLSTPHPQTK